MRWRQLDVVDKRASTHYSKPRFELFAEQPAAYRASVIGNTPVKIAVEAAIRQGWDCFIGRDGDFVGMQSFGASGPARICSGISA
ncbi:hypothetical protein C8D77_1011157 [Mesorhizobium loti]|jgi:transketolase|uniref:Transketolase-like C-terminal domain-containing protein n=1 Tax=Rhizobium loti TaxID=381 RepID=A0A8E2WKX6_RHILI|nr:hypothetical protein C8D77_1011157 [Mesorhizobium loti]